jgi:hypothetical protein
VLEGADPLETDLLRQVDEIEAGDEVEQTCQR